VSVSGVQLHVPPPLQVFGATHCEGVHETEPPQPFGAVPEHWLPQACAAVSGEQHVPALQTCEPVHSDDVQPTEPPQPFDAEPVHWLPHACACVRGLQPHVPPMHVSGAVHCVEVQLTLPPQPFEVEPEHWLPHACAEVSGVHEHMPPEHVSEPVQSEAVQFTVPPHPFGCVPEHLRPHACAAVSGMQLHIPPLQVAGGAHWLDVHVTVPPHPFGVVPEHWLPHACAAVSGLQPHWFATLAPPHVLGSVHMPQSTALPQLSVTLPHTPLVHGDTGVHADLHVPPEQLPEAQSEATPHVLPFAQSGHGPPQSTSLSPWLRAPSLHVPWQLPQTPPQSTPVSAPSFTWSWQPHAGFCALPLHESPLGLVHACFGSLPAFTGPHTPSGPLPFAAAVHASQPPAHSVSQQMPSTQAPPFAHTSPLAHGAPGHLAGHGPPQSTPASPWFFTPSLHVPGRQLGHVPPQSVCVSPGSCTASMQWTSGHWVHVPHAPHSHVATSR
jgi:hypothetical protein